MKKIIQKLTSLTIVFGAVFLLAACGGGCGGGHHDDMRHHRGMHGAPDSQGEVIMYEAEAVEVVAVPQQMPMMKAKMYTRSRNGGTSEMGYIKFTPGENGVNMMVDVTDLRPGKDYTVKIYPCGKCSDYSCCSSQCMNLNLPVLSIDTPGRLTQTFNISGLSCSDLKNAKIVLMRDGGYKAAWGKIKWVNKQ